MFVFDLVHQCRHSEHQTTKSSEFSQATVPRSRSLSVNPIFEYKVWKHKNLIRLLRTVPLLGVLFVT